MHRRLPDVIEGAIAMQSSLASRTVSNVIQVTLRWGGWGSNPRPADYEKPGPALRLRYLHRWHGVVPPMALIALFAPMARSTNRSTHSMVITGCQLQNVTADSAAATSLRRRCWPTVVMLFVPRCMKHGSARAFINQEVRRLARCSTLAPPQCLSTSARFSSRCWAAGCCTRGSRVGWPPGWPCRSAVFSWSASRSRTWSYLGHRRGAVPGCGRLLRGRGGVPEAGPAPCLGRPGHCVRLLVPAPLTGGERERDPAPPGCSGELLVSSSRRPRSHGRWGAAARWPRRRMLPVVPP